MGIGRREFLRLFGGALASFATQTSSAVALLDDLYINRRLGIALRKPSGWHFGDVQEMGHVTKGQLLELADPQLVSEIRESGELPIVTMTQLPLNAKSGNFTPGINVFLENFSDSDEIWTDVRNDPRFAAELDAEVWPTVLKNFRVHSSPTTTRIPGCDAGCYTASFDFEHVQLKEAVPVRLRSLILLERPSWYTIRMYDSPYLGGPFERDYADFVSTIRII
jgi:hypothetical protein